MTEAEVEAEREQQRKLMLCVCGARKKTAFFDFCDRCWARLPWKLRMTIITGVDATSRQEAKQAADLFLREAERPVKASIRGHSDPLQRALPDPTKSGSTRLHRPDSSARVGRHPSSDSG